MFLPSPVKTQGNDKQVGTSVECTYSRGSLVKRITVLERPRLVRFEVLEQHLGVERCMTTVEGSYEFRAEGRAPKLRSPRGIAGTCARAGSGVPSSGCSLTSCTATSLPGWMRRGRASARHARVC